MVKKHYAEFVVALVRTRTIVTHRKWHAQLLEYLGSSHQRHLYDFGASLSSNYYCLKKDNHLDKLAKVQLSGVSLTCRIRYLDISQYRSQ
jgi:hypothetical protein